MFSQSSINSMSLDTLISTIKTMAGKIDSNIQDHPTDALDYCETLINLSNCLRERIECVLED